MTHPMTPFAIVLLASFATGVSDCRADDSDSKSRPNIVLVMADDQGWGDVAYNGHPHVQTPMLDEMARTGLRFDRFYAAAPVCSPTRGSVLTGRHPNRFGCFSWGHPLRPEEVTMAEVLRKAGYATGHFGKWHLGDVTAGGPTSPGNSGFDEWFSSPNFYENDPLLSHRGRVVETKGESSLGTVEIAVEHFIGPMAQTKQPFLAVIWFGNPHTPHVPTDDLRALYPNLPEKQRNYCAEITGIDRAMGRLRRALRELDIAENTLLWYTSDNGAQGPGSTGGLRGKKGSLWEGGVRVPGIIEWPARIRSARVTSRPSGTVDIYPTVLELAGAEPPAGQPPLDGESLVRLIDGADEPRAKPMGFWVYPEPGIRTPSAEVLQAMRREQPGEELAAVRQEEATGSRTPYKTFREDMRPGPAAWLDGDLKLHAVAEKDGTVRHALFDLAADPEESRDVAASRADDVRRMASELESWQKSVLRSLNGADYDKK